MHDATNATTASDIRQSMTCPPSRGTGGLNGVLVSPPRAPSLLSRLIEISQVRRDLALLGRHQIAVRAEIVGLLPDQDMRIVLGAIVVEPERALVTTILLGHRPRPGQRIVDRGDVVEQYARIGLVEVNSLLDHGLVVAMERQAARLEGARPLHVARLDLEHVVAAVPVLVDPTSQRVAGEGRIDLRGRARRCRSVAASGSRTGCT